MGDKAKTVEKKENKPLNAPNGPVDDLVQMHRKQEALMM